MNIIINQMNKVIKIRYINKKIQIDINNKIKYKYELYYDKLLCYLKI